MWFSFLKYVDFFNWTLTNLLIGLPYVYEEIKLWHDTSHIYNLRFMKKSCFDMIQVKFTTGIQWLGHWFSFITQSSYGSQNTLWWKIYPPYHKEGSLILPNWCGMLHFGNILFYHKKKHKRVMAWCNWNLIFDRVCHVVPLVFSLFGTKCSSLSRNNATWWYPSEYEGAYM